ncbi:hypothetical protein Tco_0076284, partial [Tanacetum coccineum]
MPRYHTYLSLSYVADSDPEEDPEEDHADYPADRGDDDDEPSDDDDDDDDTDDEDEEPFEDEDDDEEEEEHLASADSPTIPIVDLIPLAGDTEAFETDEAAPTPVPSPRWHTVRISIRTEAPIPFPSEEEVERLLTLPPPPPSPLISLSPPSVEECICFRAAMCRLRASSPSTHHPLHPSPLLPPPPSSLHLPPQVPTSLPLPSSPLPSSLFIPPLVNRREDILEAELPPRKRLCLTTLTLMYEVGESSTAAPTPTGGHRTDYGFIGTMDTKIRRQRA